MGLANAINNGSNLLLGGGKFDTGGFSQSLNTLTLSANSAIDMGTQASVLQFANSSAAAWTANRLLSIVNWSGTSHRQRNRPGDFRHRQQRFDGRSAK